MAGALAELDVGAVRPVLVLASSATQYVEVLVAGGSPVQSSPNFEKLGYEDPLGEIRRWVKTEYPAPPYVGGHRTTTSTRGDTSWPRYRY